MRLDLVCTSVLQNLHSIRTFGFNVSRFWAICLVLQARWLTQADGKSSKGGRHAAAKTMQRAIKGPETMVTSCQAEYG